MGDIEEIKGTKIKDAIIDAIIVSNVFFQVNDKDKFIEEIRRILKPNGQILFIDWLPETFVTKVNKGKIFTKEKIQEMFKKKELEFIRNINTGEHHYGMILKKK